MQLSKGIVEQISAVYRSMVKDARYRPAAPSDGCGNITVPTEKLNLEEECLKYSGRWWEEEDRQLYRLGCCNYSTRPSAILAIEAVRNLNAGNMGNQTALELLQLAVKELQEVIVKNKRGEVV
jgi:hypothetical protein